jgi:hypothetical protein
MYDNDNLHQANVDAFLQARADERHESFKNLAETAALSAAVYYGPQVIRAARGQGGQPTQGGQVSAHRNGTITALVIIAIVLLAIIVF